MLPNVRRLEGVPLAPGRAKLLEFPRPHGYTRPVAAPEPALRPRMTWAWGGIVLWVTLLAHFLGWAFGVSSVQPGVRRQLEASAAVAQTNEILDGLLWEAHCALLHVEADHLYHVGERFPGLLSVLTPELRAQCRGYFRRLPLPPAADR